LCEGEVAVLIKRLERFDPPQGGCLRILASNPQTGES